MTLSFIKIPRLLDSYQTSVKVTEPLKWEDVVLNLNHVISIHPSTLTNGAKVTRLHITEGSEVGTLTTSVPFDVLIDEMACKLDYTLSFNHKEPTP